MDKNMAQNEISYKERQQIDRRIEALLEAFSGQEKEINHMMTECMAALTGNEAKQREIASGGLFKKVIGEVTGKNRKLERQADDLMAQSQYCALRMLEKMAEQNLMTFDMLVQLNNKINALVEENDAAMKRVYGELGEVYDRIILVVQKCGQMEKKVEKHDTDIGLLKWSSSIRYQIFDGIEYGKLDDFEKLVCLICDFDKRTEGKWDCSDLILLKSTMENLGIMPDERISSSEFIKRVESSDKLKAFLGELLLYSERENYGTEENFSYYDLAAGLLREARFLKNEAHNRYLNQKVEEAERLFLQFSMREAYSLFAELSAERWVRANYFLAKFFEDSYDNIVVSKELQEKWLCEGWRQREPLCTSVYLRNAIHMEKAERFEDFVRCRDELMKMAKDGDIFAAYELGHCFLCNIEEQNLRLANLWFEKAAKDGYWKANHSLGISYLIGRGEERNPEKAMSCFYEAAEAGYSAAQFNLAFLLLQGSEGKNNRKEALYWYEKARQQGYRKKLQKLESLISDEIRRRIDE